MDVNIDLTHYGRIIKLVCAFELVLDNESLVAVLSGDLIVSSGLCVGFWIMTSPETAVFLWKIL